jgi:Ca2+-binding EF-hand superfamily protein
MSALSEAQVQQLCDSFKQLDRNKDGFVDAAEIDEMLAETFPGLDAETQVAVRHIILSEGDTNNDGRIDVGEFLTLIAKRQYDTLMGIGGAPAASSEQQQPQQSQDEPQTLAQTADGEQGAAAAAAEEQEASIEDPQVAAIMRELTPEDIDMYRDAFIRLDRNGDGFVGRDELMVGIREHVGEQRFGPLYEYLDKIFDVADRDRDNMLSLTEFLASFAHGPGVVPQDVIIHLVASIRVRLTDDEICSLQESFRNIDKNQDGYIDPDELFAALKELLQQRTPDLTDQAFHDIVKIVLETADRDHDGRLNLAEFIRSFQEDQGVLPTAFIDGRAQRVARRLTKEEVAVLKEAFKQLDSNNDGFVDYAEMYTALSDILSASVLNQDQVRDLVDLIMVTADRNKDGKLHLTEFIANFVNNADLMTLPVVAANERAQVASKRLQDLLQTGEVSRMVKVFDFLDANRDGFLDKSELNTVLGELLKEKFPEWDAETTDAVIDAIVTGADTDKDGKISLEEFIESFVKGAGILPSDIVHEWGDLLKRELTAEEFQVVQNTFLAMDADHDGFVSREELANALYDALGEVLESEEHLQRVTDFVMNKVDTDQDGKVSLKEFVSSFEKNEGVLPVINNGGAEQTQETQPAEAAPASEPAAAEAQPPSPASQPARPVSPVGRTLEGSEETLKPLPPPERLTAVSPDHHGPLPELVTSPQAQPAQTPAKEVAPLNPVAAATPAAQKAAIVHTIKSPIANDVSGVAISEEQLAAEFRKYDKLGRGYLDRAEFKKAYLALENYGLEPSQFEIDSMFHKYGGGSDRVTFDEFCILMLHRSRM